jgi:RES domain-containing protein
MGARLAGGRWNRPGTAVVYTSETLALATLEYLVHVDADDLPADLAGRSAEILDAVAVRRLDASALPADWQRYPAPVTLADIGTEWVDRGETAVLAVPSAIIPFEWNYLLNPAHPQFTRVRVGRAQALSVDRRLLRPRPRRP